MDIIDTIGLNCPLPVLKLEKYLANVSGNFELKLLADDEMAIIDIAHFCNNNGYLCQSIKSEKHYIFLIKNK